MSNLWNPVIKIATSYEKPLFLSLYYTGTGKSTSEVKYVGVYMLPIHNDFQLFHFVGIRIS